MATGWYCSTGSVSKWGPFQGAFQSLNGNILGEHEDQWNQLNGFLVSAMQERHQGDLQSKLNRQ